MRSVWTRCPRDTLPDTLLVPLSGRNVRATEAVQRLLRARDPVVFPLERLADDGRRVLRCRRWEHLAFVGTPPADEIGYSLGAMIALISRPKQVALIDIVRGTVVIQPLWNYLLRSVPFAVSQLFGSTVAVGAQSLALPVARRAPRGRKPSPKLTKLVYLRPAVGSSTGVGGSVTHSHEVIRALQTEGVQVHAYTTDPAIAETAALEHEAPCKWCVVATPRLTKAVPVSAALGGDAALVCAALPAAREADAIYQRHARFSLIGPVLAWLSRKPLLLEYNGSEAFVGRYWNPTPLMRRLIACEDAVLTGAACVIVVSEVDRALLVDRGVEPDRIVLNPNGVDADRFARGGGGGVRRGHGIRAEDLVIGFVGTFGSWHGARILATAFVRVAKDNPRSHLLLVGDGPELQATRDIVRRNGLDSRLTAVGQVAPAEVPVYLDASDILVAPQVPLPGGVEFFGSPTKLFEYMAAGKAIVASRLGQIGNVLEHGVTGWLVEAGDVGELAEALCILADAPEQRRELGARARRKAVESHSWRRNARRIAGAYSELAARVAV
jgi:glycosyltransferase involved in cell wall biosynthesis